MLAVAGHRAAALLMANAWAGSKEDFDEAMSADGLQKIKVKGIDVAYALPGATLAGYNKVINRSDRRRFHKDWDPERTGSRFKLSAEERENIRTGSARSFTRIRQGTAEEQQLPDREPILLKPVRMFSRSSALSLKRLPVLSGSQSL